MVDVSDKPVTAREAVARGRIHIAPASITAVAYRPHGPSVLTVNSVSGDLGWLGGKP